MTEERDVRLQRLHSLRERGVNPYPNRVTRSHTIAEALDHLAPRHREVIVLVGLEEMSYRDVAEILGVPLGTVMSRLSRAREQLRQMLEDRGHTVLRRVK